MKVYLCRPRGFCAGVERAIETVERALERFGRPVFVRHEIVHNRLVVDDLTQKGAVFVDDLDKVPPGSHLIFSAHGVSPLVVAQARDLSLHAIDATCPLVTKVHFEARRFAQQGLTILLIGHADHVEVEGVVGEAPGRIVVVATPSAAETVQVPDPDKVAVLTQTTLSVDEAMRVMAVLQRRFPRLRTPRKEDICYATTNRQMAVKNLRGKVDLWLVIGDRMSSNSNRLRELGAESGVPSRLVLDAEEIGAEWFTPDMRVGITSGASTPEGSVQAVVQRLRNLGAESVEEVDGTAETVEFQLPVEVR
jgi:4-hydroxy-3-methylbut-2-en-1-yl diphosphate reductase